MVESVKSGASLRTIYSTQSAIYRVLMRNLSENEPLFRLANIESLSLSSPTYGDPALVTGGTIVDGKGENAGKTKHNSSSN